MGTMKRYKSIKRTTLDNLDYLPNLGVYIMAYLGRVLYVGKSNCVHNRIIQHMKYIETEIDHYLWKISSDYINVRLDVLECPDDADGEAWIKETEAQLINRFKPVFNVMLNN